jgi:hypothetical protein
MNIPVFALLIPYAIFLVFILIRLFSNMYHVLRYAYLHRASLVMASLFLAAVAVVLTVTIQAVPPTTWGTTTRVTLPSTSLQPNSLDLP